MGRRLDMPGFPNNIPAQWDSDSRGLSAESLRDGSVTVRVTIGGTYMGETIPLAEADELGKFLLEAGIAYRAANPSTATPGGNA